MNTFLAERMATEPYIELMPRKQDHLKQSKFGGRILLYMKTESEIPYQLTVYTGITGDNCRVEKRTNPKRAGL